MTGLDLTWLGWLFLAVCGAVSVAQYPVIWRHWRNRRR